MINRSYFLKLTEVASWGTLRKHVADVETKNTFLKELGILTYSENLKLTAKRLIAHPSIHKKLTAHKV